LNALSSSDLAQGIFRVLHKPGLLLAIGESQFHVLYPLIPWFPLMYLGYLWGRGLASGESFGAKTHLWLGCLLWVLFLLVRTGTSFGEPKAFLGFSGSFPEALTLLYLTKYPPSLLFLLFTMGGIFILAGLFSFIQTGSWMRRLEVFGRTSLFVYVLHLFVVHSVAVILAWVQPNVVLQNFNLVYEPPANFGYPVSVVCAVGLFAMLLCYPICCWFDGLKSGTYARWLKYF